MESFSVISPVDFRVLLLSGSLEFSYRYLEQVSGKSFIMLPCDMFGIASEKPASTDLFTSSRHTVGDGIVGGF